MSAIKYQAPKNNHERLSSYTKYQPQYKRKSILTRLSNDSGYPQQILNPSETSREKNNYVHNNKKNLNNFCKERIPAENILLNKLMKRQIETIHPKRVFEMKQQEFQLKYQSKKNMAKLQPNLAIEKQSNLQKIDCNFHPNYKNQHCKQKSKKYLSIYQGDNYQRGTQSHIGKRSKILKKQAYVKVFGPDVSALSRTSGLVRPYTQKANHPPSKVKSTMLYIEGQKHKALKGLIHKMNGYKNKLQERNDVCQLDLSQHQPSVEFDSNLITTIRNMTKFYQGKNTLQGHHRVEKLQDLAGIYKDYYEDLLNHRTQRLNRRREMISSSIGVGSNSSQSPRKHLQSSSHLNRSVASYNDVQSIEEEDLEPTTKQVLRFNIKHHFRLLKTILVRWATLAYIHGIQKANIFLAFKYNNQAYELQGSYAFFKCIKMGQLQSLRGFLSKNGAYAFQVQAYGKTPLSYACIHNQLEIAKLILQEGVNCDKVCKNKRTSLFYAMKSRNVELIKAILQKGASPWSTIHNPYSQMAKSGENEEEITNLINNAKKIYLGMQIQRTIRQRKEFWQKYKSKISEKQRLEYGFYYE